MSKTLTIQVRSTRDLSADFRDAFTAAQGRKSFKKREGAYFTSLEAVRNFLTKERLALLHAIREKHPRSIYELARTVERDLKNVQQDVALLEHHGLIKLKQKRRGEKGRVKTPEAPFDEIALRIAI